MTSPTVAREPGVTAATAFTSRTTSTGVFAFAS